MDPQTQPVTPSLHEADETAWLEETAELVRNGEFEPIDREALIREALIESLIDRAEGTGVKS